MFVLVQLLPVKNGFGVMKCKSLVCGDQLSSQSYYTAE